MVGIYIFSYLWVLKVNLTVSYLQGIFMVQEAFSLQAIEGNWWTFWFKESGAVFFLMELN